jgi:hypothetical protein
MLAKDSKIEEKQEDFWWRVMAKRSRKGIKTSGKMNAHVENLDNKEVTGTKEIREGRQWKMGQLSRSKSL